MNIGDLLRELKELHPLFCMDVGSAALRDLGYDDYNRGWIPSTLVLGSGGHVTELSQTKH